MSSTFSLFFFNDTATTEIYTLSLHDALPISNSDEVTGTAARPSCCSAAAKSRALNRSPKDAKRSEDSPLAARSEEHTSELQSRGHLVCRLLLEKKKKKKKQLDIRKEIK